MLLIQSPESVILSQMKRTAQTTLLLIQMVYWLSGTSQAQLPEIIGRSRNPQQSGGLIIEPRPSRPASSTDPAISSTSQKPGSTAGLNVKRRLEWFSVMFDGKPVGYESVATSEENATGLPESTRIRRNRETRLKLKRFGSDLSVSASLETLETADGLLLSWSLRRTAADGARLERSGEWNPDDHRYVVTDVVGGVRKEQVLDVTVQPRSPIITTWIRSMGTDVDIRWGSAVLFPETNAVADIEIAGQGLQQISLATNQRVQTTRYDFWPADAPENKSSAYFDPDGNVIRIEQPLLGQTLTLERAENAEALGQKTLDALDVQFTSLIPVKRPISLEAQQTTLTLQFSSGATEHFELPASDFQSVERPEPGKVLVTLTKPTIVQKEEKIFIPPKIRTDSEYQRPSRWITSEDQTVQRMGVMVAGNSVLPEEKCVRLTDHLFRKMRHSAFSTSLIPASDIARTMQGDCTEYATLLAALMRSQGVPSRVVVGFVYVPRPSSFAPHMWTEAYIDDKWIPFDATLGSKGIGLTHVKMADSALTDDIASGTVLFVPLLPLLGRTTVDYIPPKDFGTK